MEETRSSLWKHFAPFQRLSPHFSCFTLELFLSCSWHFLADTDTYLAGPLVPCDPETVPLGGREGPAATGGYGKAVVGTCGCSRDGGCSVVG